MDPFSGLEGLPHLVVASGQTLPNVIGVRELRATGFLCLHTKAEPADRLAGTLIRSGAHPLASPVVIDALDTEAIETVLRSKLAEWRALCPRGFVWNYTPGTKQMLLGCLRGLAVGTPESILRGAISVDTANGLLRLDQPSAARPFRVHLDVASLLDGHGIPRWMPGIARWRGYAARLRDDSDDELRFRQASLSILPHLGAIETRLGGMRRGRVGLSSPNDLARVFRDLPEVFSYLHELPPTFKPGNVLNGVWLEGAVAGALDRLRADGRVDDVQRAVELLVHDRTGWKVDTDLDAVTTVENRLTYFSCKTDSIEACKEELFQIVARKEVGGTFARGVLVHWHAPTAKKAQALQARAALLGITVLDRRALADERTLENALADLLSRRPAHR